jgi:hypothetical protein
MFHDNDVLRTQMLERTPDPAERKDRMLQGYRFDLERRHPWLPGAYFVANPGLDSYILACLQAWEPAARPATRDAELIGLYTALIAFLRANDGRTEATAALLRAIATDVERDVIIPPLTVREHARLNVLTSRAIERDGELTNQERLAALRSRTRSPRSHRCRDCGATTGHYIGCPQREDNT